MGHVHVCLHVHIGTHGINKDKEVPLRVCVCRVEPTGRHVCVCVYMDVHVCACMRVSGGACR